MHQAAPPHRRLSIEGAIHTVSHAESLGGEFPPLVAVLQPRHSTVLRNPSYQHLALLHSAFLSLTLRLQSFLHDTTLRCRIPFLHPGAVFTSTLVLTPFPTAMHTLVIVLKAPASTFVSRFPSSRDIPTAATRCPNPCCRLGCIHSVARSGRHRLSLLPSRRRQNPRYPEFRSCEGDGVVLVSCSYVEEHQAVAARATAIGYLAK